MKLIALILSIGLLSCNNQTKQTDEVDKTKSSKTAPSQYYTRQDTISISTEIGDTLKYAKSEYNDIINKHPEFFKDYPENPDQAYFNANDREEFGSEVGQDNYYILYAHFLKEKNGIDKFAEERKKLIDIYANLNSLFGNLQYGGTYFGHQRKRILAYAEYSIYLLPKSKDDITKTYKIAKQKELYIKSLRQLIKDESKIDFQTLGQEKIERTKKLNKIVDELYKLITDIFYLRRTQEFQYLYYEYY